ncbi:MAG: hypothetical protein HC853_17310 [Anaerolineae bacterium]|nr:hypothetical protein [Anaerolineae bacterium]
MRYRAGLGAVLRCGTIDRGMVFAKVFAGDEGEKSFGLLQQLHTQNGLRTPTPIAFFTDVFR